MSDNPYEPSKSLTGPPDIGLLSLKTVGFVFLVGVLGGVVGVMIGCGVALLAPEYYVQLFNPSGAVGFSPVRLGITLGGSQGFGGGIGVGVLLAVAEAWLSSRRRSESAGFG